MASTFHFAGSIDDKAVPHVDDPRRYREALRTLAGKRVEFVVRKQRTKRSLDMNAYLHSETGPFRLLAEHFGDSIEGVKYDLAGECFGWVKGAVTGREVPARPNTSEWTVEESRFFVDWVIPWALVNHQVEIEPPREKAA